MSENTNPNRTFFHGNLLKRRHSQSNSSVKAPENREELFTDLLNILFEKDR